MPGINPLGMHMSMFTSSIENLASDEQKEEWLDLVKNFEICGCYAQTELGHGSNVAGLETTATLDFETDEWVINSPTITSTKMWPGSLGLMANHALVMARIVIDDESKNDYGVQSFLVPIRDENHKPFPGVEVGDIASKLGFSSMDNGYLKFDKVRIPRTNMLTRFANITEEGEFEILGDPRLLYGIMVRTRLFLLYTSGFRLFQSLCIAARYAVCRHEFSTIPD